MLGSPPRIITREVMIWQLRHLGGKNISLTFYSEKGKLTLIRRYYEYS